jgi:hypothetical protein
MTAMDAASETGDFVVDVMTVSGEEISNVVADTSETFTTEVTRAYNETTDAFIDDLEKAQDAIKKARDDLQEAINKLSELATKANEAAAALNNANGSVSMEMTPPGAGLVGGAAGSGGIVENIRQGLITLGEAVTQAGVPNPMVEGVINNSSPDDAALKLARAALANRPYFESSDPLNDGIIAFLKNAGYYIGSVNDKYRVYKKEGDLTEWLRTNAQSSQVKRYLNGGLADYTGYAYVDGTPEEPEGFLTAEDTRRIGEAAKILSDVPVLDRDSESSTVVNNGGDISVEINLNIDHISSDVDIDEMIKKVKEEVVEVARPAGTNVILNQQLG